MKCNYQKNGFTHQNAHRLVQFTILLVGIIIVIVPYILASHYAIYSSDDYANYLKVKQLGIMGYCSNVYLTWQGTYSGNLLVALGSFVRYGNIPLKIESFVCVVCFFCSLCMLTSTILVVLVQLKKNIVINGYVFILTALLVLYSLDPSELFYWHTGICMYTIPLIVSFVTLALDLKFRNKDLWIIGLECLLAFVAAGGVLQVSVFLCAGLLLVNFFDYLLTHKIKLNLIVFFVSLVGTVINVLAPGNFVRKEADTGKGLLLLGAARVSVQDILREVRLDIKSGMLILYIFVLFLVIFVCIHSNSDDRIKEIKINPLFVFALCFFLICITIYPVELGYNCTGLSIRGIFVLRCFWGILFFVSIGYLELYLIVKYVIYIDRLVVFMVTLVAIAISMNNILAINGVDDIKPIYIYKEIANGDLQNFEEKSKCILESIKADNNEEVVIKTEIPDGQGILCNLGLTEDSNWWVNKTIATYYGKKSVRIAK